MSERNEWSETVPQVIYEAYPDCDVLLIDPPRPGETIHEFALRAEDAGDTLFLFLCREADDEIEAQVYIGRLDRAIGDIQSVRAALRAQSHPGPQDSGTDKRDVTIRIALDSDWIELAMSYADAHGRRSGTVTSSLHTSEQDGEEFNAAMDAIESMVLAHACAGIDVTESRYVEGVRTCIDACANNLPGGDV